jgi:hypothetical protein
MIFFPGEKKFQEFPMADGTPWIEHLFSGIKTFRDLMDQAGISCEEVDTPGGDAVFTEAAEFLNATDDTLQCGVCQREGHRIWYADFGLKITKSYFSHITFVFTRMPVKDDLVLCARVLPDLVDTRLGAVDLSALGGNVGGTA